MTDTLDDRPDAGRTGGKLVRDRIPEIIRKAGGEPVVWTADAAQYRELLRAKLREEVNEFLAADDPHELADVLEVVFALAADLGYDRRALEEMRAEKAAARGGFGRRLVLVQ